MTQVTNHHRFALLIATLLIAGNIGCVTLAQSNDDNDDDTSTEPCEWKVQHYNNSFRSGFWTLNALYWNSCTGKIYHLYDPFLHTGRFNVEDYELDVNITVTEIIVTEVDINDDGDDTSTESCEWKAQYSNSGNDGIGDSEEVLNALFWNSCTGKVYHLYDRILSTGGDDGDEVELDVNITVTEITVTEVDTNDGDDGDTPNDSCEWLAQYQSNKSEEVLNALFWNSCTGKVYHLYDPILSTGGDDGDEVELDVNITVTEITVTEVDASDDDDTLSDSCEWKAQHSIKDRSSLMLNALFWNSCTGKVYHLYDPELSTGGYIGGEIDVNITVTEIDTNDDETAPNESCEWNAQYTNDTIFDALNALFWNSCTGKVYHLYDPRLHFGGGLYLELDLDVNITVTEITVTEIDTNDDDDGDTSTDFCEWKAQYNIASRESLNALFWNSCTGKVYHLYDEVLSTGLFTAEEVELDVNITVTEITVTEVDTNDVDDDDTPTESCEWIAQYHSDGRSFVLNAIFWNSCASKIYHLYDPRLFTGSTVEEVEPDVNITVTEITVTEVDTNDDDDASTESCDWKAQFNSTSRDEALNALFWNSCASKVYHLYEPILYTEGDDGEELEPDVNITITEIDIHDDDDTPNESCEWKAQYNNLGSFTVSVLNALFWNSCTGTAYHLYDPILSTGGRDGEDVELDVNITVTDVDTNDDDDASTGSCEWKALYSTSRIDEALNAVFWNSCTGKGYHLYDPFLHTGDEGEEVELDVNITVTEIETAIP